MSNLFCQGLDVHRQSKGFCQWDPASLARLQPAERPYIYNMILVDAFLLEMSIRMRFVNLGGAKKHDAGSEREPTLRTL